MEELKAYFESVKGRGVLSTADAEGQVNAAIFATPHFLEDGTLGFIMPDRLTHKNLTENGFAHFLFIEDGPGYKGKRLHLVKTGEEKNTERLFNLRRRNHPHADSDTEPRFLVSFKLAKELPLIGPGK